MLLKRAQSYVEISCKFSDDVAVRLLTFES
jgi:hypothetical protein